MSGLTLVIGNRNYSSWSLRAWLVLRHFGIPFEEIQIPLYIGDWREQLAKYSPTMQVPVLLARGVKTWETLAIAEYVAELSPEAGIWPPAAEARALARAISSEMHAGFASLRGAMPMNVRASYPGHGQGSGVAEDIARVTAIWRECREKFGGGGAFLFGDFCAADAMFAPVVSRLNTYGVELDDVCQAYADAVLTLPAFVEWAEACRSEPWTIEKYEFR